MADESTGTELLEEFEKDAGLKTANAASHASNVASQTSTLSREWETVSPSAAAAAAANVPDDPWHGKVIVNPQVQGHFGQDLWTNWTPPNQPAASTSQASSPGQQQSNSPDMMQSIQKMMQDSQAQMMKNIQAMMQQSQSPQQAFQGQNATTAPSAATAPEGWKESRPLTNDERYNPHATSTAQIDGIMRVGEHL